MFEYSCMCGARGAAAATWTRVWTRAGTQEDLSPEDCRSRGALTMEKGRTEVGSQLLLSLNTHWLERHVRPGRGGPDEGESAVTTEM